MHSEHLRHDRLLIARYAADDSYPTEVQEARAQIEACTECAAIAKDIRLVSRAMATIPVPARPRDFRITAEQAEGLRGSWLERVMRRFAAPGIGTLRPVAGVALSIGLVMALAGALPSFTPAGPASEEIGFPAPAAQEVKTPRPADRSAGAPMASGAASEYMGPVSASASDAPSGVGDGQESEINATLEPITENFDTVHNASPDAGRQRLEASDLDDNVTSTSSMLTYAGLLIALTSLGVLIVAWVARRRFSDRLLR